MRRTWATPRGILTHAVVDLSVAAVLIVVSIMLLVSGNRGGVYTCILGGIALIGGSFALYAYYRAQAAAAAEQPDADAEAAEAGG